MRSAPAEPFDDSARCRIAVALILWFGASPLGSAAIAPMPGVQAPMFAGARLGGGRVTLESLRGHVVLLNFWMLECPPCRIEMPELEKIHRRYAGRGLRVLGIAEMDPAPDQVSRFVEELGVTYPMLLDAGARIAALYAIEAHPASVVIDARGIVRFVNHGYLRGEEREIEEAVREALDAGAPSRAPGAAQGNIR